jgi:hypothetical protein
MAAVPPLFPLALESKANGKKRMRSQRDYGNRTTKWAGEGIQQRER